MTALRSGCVLAAVVLFAGLTSISRSAPPAGVVNDPYSLGVQAYFSGNYAAAEQWLAEAIGRDLKDPRPVYFHGLCLLRQGRSDEARGDFTVAASLEARSRKSYPVGKSLERVQGADRLLLEKFRWQAVSAQPTIVGNPARSTSDRNSVTSYPAEAGTRRRQGGVPLDRSVQPASLSELIEDSSSSPAATPNSGGPTANRNNPFADDPASAPGGKITSGKLIGIVGRALIQAAPIPSFDGWRGQSPMELPIATDQGLPDQTDVDFGADSASPSTVEDPFAEPAASGAVPVESEPASQEIEEDPFG